MQILKLRSWHANYSFSYLKNDRSLEDLHPKKSAGDSFYIIWIL